MNKITIIVSNWSSKLMIIFILVYLFIKTLVNPVFTYLDVELSLIVPAAWNIEWLSIINGVPLSSDVTYLPEAKFDLLFELGLYFPKEM